MPLFTATAINSGAKRGETGHLALEGQRDAGRGRAWRTNLATSAYAELVAPVLSCGVCHTDTSW